ncbi:hypothetical protein EVA_18168 [gut metagenome]|uniref:Uncharacterized protein n=1 Tax=gut metagenome TaxID=749906 RepID=J9FVX9_9ZZZZ
MHSRLHFPMMQTVCCLLSCLYELCTAQTRNDSVSICFQQGKASIDTNYLRYVEDLFLLKEALTSPKHPMGILRGTIKG